MLRVWNLIEAPSDYDDVFDTQIPVPIIRVAAGEHPRVVDESEAALIAAGLPLYPRGNAIVRPIVEVVPAAGEGATIIWQDPVSSLLSRPD